ncbi:oxidoreductase domain protein [Thermobaculum terrenum ATCC BAA-798]|uniref:Oxidoreductase domain protein n=1 Tax=Thermobaculum terrenum (strain ATCC BAA-798 / CCMEE 7001 / YNP1) TaxID=525904 RepID=D1CF63_THET1|nr:Gfo/Idh/MocA family oxidoreductase [Thermobaculum terrenum]ACZ41569.1 oxidoreductase domain protein [Thermobaculum terrenum ATCC BAA-798]
MTVKIGLIGCGGIAHQHARGYTKYPDLVKVTAVCDIVEGNRQEIADIVGGAEQYSDYHKMLQEADIDGVDILLPHHLHKDAIVAAAKAGKYIMCEKPLCLNMQEAEEIRQVVRENGVTLMCAHNQLFYPSVQKAKEILDQGLLGKIYEIRTVDTFFNKWVNANAGWRASRELVGGGELIDTGYHPSYLLLYLAASEPVEVVAMLSRHRLNIEGEDSAQVLVRFENGAVGNIVTSWAYDKPEGWSQFLVIGENGQLYRKDNNLVLALDGQEPQVYEFPAVNTFHIEMGEYAKVIAEGKRPLQNEEDGIRVLELILGAYKSAEEKRIVSLGAVTA